MKKLIVLAFAFFALAAMAGEPKKGELSPEKEAFLNARYEEFKKSCAQKDARACKRVILFYQKQPKKQNEKRHSRSDANFARRVQGWQI